MTKVRYPSKMGFVLPILTCICLSLIETYNFFLSIRMYNRLRQFILIINKNLESKRKKIRDLNWNRESLTPLFEISTSVFWTFYKLKIFQFFSEKEIQKEWYFIPSCHEP